MLDIQEGVVEMKELWKAWQETKYNPEQEREDEDEGVRVRWGLWRCGLCLCLICDRNLFTNLLDCTPS